MHSNFTEDNKAVCSMFVKAIAIATAVKVVKIAAITAVVGVACFYGVKALSDK